MTALNENLTGPADPNIATTDENLSIKDMFQQASVPSLARQILPVVQMHGPTAALFNIRPTPTSLLNVPGANEIQLLRQEVVMVSPSVPIPTVITDEVVQDMKNVYGKRASDIIGKLLRGLTNEVENTDCLSFLSTNSVVYTTPTLTLSAPTNTRTTYYEVTQMVQEIVLHMNSNHFKTYESFCVLPFRQASAFTSVSKLFRSDDSNGHDGLFLAKIGSTSYYVSPDPTTTVAYVGICDLNDPSKSCGVFSPYMDDVVEATNFNSGVITYNIYNRYAFGISPLHTGGQFNPTVVQATTGVAPSVAYTALNGVGGANNHVMLSNFSII